MTSGYGVDTSALHVAGRVFIEAGQTLTDQGNALVSDIDPARTGRAWPGVAGPYQALVGQFSDKVIDYAVATTRAGNHLTASAGQYDGTEDATTRAFTGGN